MIQYPVWKDWTTTRRIGTGSFGTVYEIQRQFHGIIEKAAMKVITVPKDEEELHELKTEGYDEAGVQRLYAEQFNTIVKEYEMMRTLNGNTNVVNCDDIEEIRSENGLGWTVKIKMELLTPLLSSDVMEEPEKEALNLGIDICKALVLCEKYNVIHRDIKPQNIFYTEQRTYKLGDFGISRTLDRTTCATRTGTPDYMAPEVFNGKKYNRTVDIYSLGLVLYWMLNEKRLPFVPNQPKASDLTNARAMRLAGKRFPAPKHGNKDLLRIIRRACSYRPEKRYSTAEDMLDALLKLRRKLETEGKRNKDEKFEEEIRSFYKIVEAIVPVSQPETEEPKKKRTAGILLIALALIASLTAGYYSVQALSGRHDHVWIDATCTEPATCSICGKTEGESLGHEWAEATCTEPAVCRVCGETEGEALGHDWEEATCTEPAVCRVCGETEGESLGHDWEEATCTEPAACRVCGISEGEALGHEWKEATCTEPATCSVCGTTEGTALGHEWEAASCTSPKTCRICGATEGNALGHEWTAATCTSPKTCRYCGTTEGESLGHEWTAATCTSPKTCQYCGVTEGESLGHDWAEATCTEPAICRVCDTTEGEALGHDWKEPTCTESATCRVCGAAEGEPHGHDWEEATCTKPATCRICGTTEGEALAHNWIAATCTSLKTCRDCGATEGETLAHEWEEATCTEPATCRVCGTTEGESLGHDWEEATCTKPSTCRVCGATEGDALGHDWKEATCTEASACRNCGLTQGQPGDHVWQEATLTVPKKCELCGTTEGHSILGASELGDVIRFGSFEQDGNRSNGQEEIEWLVIGKEDDSVLLLSRKSLSTKPFNTADWKLSTWENSTLREWLNSEFYTTAFTEEEQQWIKLQELDNPQGGDLICDYVTLLSMDEVATLYPNEKDRTVEPTIKAEAELRGMTTNAYAWWTRSCHLVKYPIPVFSGGYFREYGMPADYNYGVRPVICLMLEDQP